MPELPASMVRRRWQAGGADAAQFVRRFAQAYARQPDGKPLFPFKRLFIVASF